MTQYVKADGAVFPYTDRDLKRDNRNVSFPAVLTDDARASVGVYPVTIAAKPVYDIATQVITQDQPQEVNGAWIVGWTVRDKSAEELAADRESLIRDIKRERDRRLPLDFEFQGVMYQRDPESIARISGAGTLALGAMVNGAQVGDLFWHGRETPFAWIASDDSLVTMDAQTCFAFGQAAAARETKIVFAAKALREMDPIPVDFVEDTYWP